MCYHTKRFFNALQKQKNYTYQLVWLSLHYVAVWHLPGSEEKIYWSFHAERKIIYYIFQCRMFPLKLLFAITKKASTSSYLQYTDISAISLAITVIQERNNLSSLTNYNISISHYHNVTENKAVAWLCWYKSIIKSYHHIFSGENYENKIFRIYNNWTMLATASKLNKKNIQLEIFLKVSLKKKCWNSRQ